MKAILFLSAIAALLTVPTFAKRAKENDQCEITYIQAYMDEECEQQYRNPEAIKNALRIVDAANKISLYADGMCAPMSRLLPKEIREPAALVANARSLTEVFGMVHCNEDGMNFKLFYDPGCGNPVVPPQDFLISYQLEGWNIYPWNFDVKWDTCYALNAQNNIFIRVTSAFGLKAAVAAVTLALAGSLF